MNIKVLFFCCIIPILLSGCMTLKTMEKIEMVNRPLKRKSNIIDSIRYCFLKDSSDLLVSFGGTFRSKKGVYNFKIPVDDIIKFANPDKSAYFYSNEVYYKNTRAAPYFFSYCSAQDIYYAYINFEHFLDNKIDTTHLVKLSDDNLAKPFKADMYKLDFFYKKHQVFHGYEYDFYREGSKGEIYPYLEFSLNLKSQKNPTEIKIHFIEKGNKTHLNRNNYLLPLTVIGDIVTLPVQIVFLFFPIGDAIGKAYGGH